VFLGPFAPGPFGIRNLLAVPGEQHGGISDQPLAAAVDVQHMQRGHRIRACRGPQECHPAAVRCHRELARLAQPELAAAGETTKKGIRTHNGTPAMKEHPQSEDAGARRACR
jgi:hypothetical protein